MKSLAMKSPISNGYPVCRYNICSQYKLW